MVVVMRENMISFSTSQSCRLSLNWYNSVYLLTMSAALSFSTSNSLLYFSTHLFPLAFPQILDFHAFDWCLVAGSCSMSRPSNYFEIHGYRDRRRGTVQRIMFLPLYTTPRQICDRNCPNKNNRQISV